MIGEHVLAGGFESSLSEEGSIVNRDVNNSSSSGFVIKFVVTFVATVDDRESSIPKTCLYGYLFNSSIASGTSDSQSGEFEKRSSNLRLENTFSTDRTRSSIGTSRTVQAGSRDFMRSMREAVSNPKRIGS